MQLNLFNKFLLLVTFETNDNYSIRFEMKSTIRTHLLSCSAGLTHKRTKDTKLQGGTKQIEN